MASKRVAGHPASAHDRLITFSTAAPEGPHVTTPVRGTSLRLLRRHVHCGAKDHADVGHHGGRRDRRRLRMARRRSDGVQGLGKAEVQHLDRAIRPYFDVGGLQIAVDDPRLMRRGQYSTICLAIGSASSSGIGPCAIRSAGVGPSTSSITRAFVPSILRSRKSGRCWDG